jgi:putative glycosyltransferase (TIGR04372 family)
MSALPPIDGFMDLSQSPKTEDWLDLFLMARCKFFIGTTSGPLIVPTLFGTQILATNAPDLGKFVYLPKGILLPKRVRKGRNSLLTLEQQLKSPAGSSDAWIEDFDGQPLEWVENSRGDILDAVEEMFHEDFDVIGEAQKSAYEMIIQAGTNDSTPIAKSFLANHMDFLE